MNRRKQFFLILGLLTLGGMLLRLAACMEMYGLSSVQKPLPVTDMATYITLAREILAGKWPAFFDYQPFYYTVFLPLCFRFSPSGGVWPAIAAQILLAGGAIWLTGICGEKLAGRKAGCLAAAILMLSRMHIFYTPFILLEVLQSFWMILILFLSLQAKRGNRWHQWLLLGLTCGLSALTRGNALLLMPGCLALAVWTNRQSWKKALLYCLLLCLFFQLPQLPYSWRNYRAKGRWYGPSVAQDKVLALGNTPEAPAGGLEYPLSYHRWCDLAYHPDPAKRISVPRQVIRWLQTDPLTWLELKWRMFLLFWNAVEIPNNVSLDLEGRNIFTLRLPFLLNFSVIGTLALMGLGFCLMRRREEDWYLFYMILMYCGSTVAFYILARFRLGCVPLLAVSAGYAAAECWSRIAQCRRNKNPQQCKQMILPAVLLLLIGFFMVNMAYDRYQIMVSAPFMKMARPYGTVAEFPDEVLIYDHAPMGNMGWSLQNPGSGQPLRVEKTFLLKPGLEKKMQGTVEYRLPVLFMNQPPLVSGTVVHRGNRYVMTLENDSLPGRKWLTAKIPALHLENGNRAVFDTVIRFMNDDAAVVMEQFRNYGRTRLMTPEGRMITIPMEFAAELHWKQQKTQP